MDYAALKAELTVDPLSRGYSSMNDAEAAADLNTAYRDRNRASMSGSEVLNAINRAEYNALSVENKGLIWNLLALGTLNPFGVEADLMVDIFGGDSATITALQADRKVAITRANELGLGVIKAGYVQKARE